MRAPLFAAAIAALQWSALAQTVTVSVEGPATAEAGDVVQLSVYAQAPDLPAAGAFAGYGLDLDVTAGATAVTGLSGATSPVMTIGRLAGTPGPASLERAVGGQLANVFSLNPAVNKSSPILLFTTSLTLDGAAPLDTMITIEASVAANGGIVIYPDANAGANITAPGAPGTSLAFTPLTITVVAPPPPCPGDIDGDDDTDVFDFGIFAANFGSPVTPGTGGDFDSDGDVDVFDFGIFAADFGCIAP